MEFTYVSWANGTDDMFAVGEWVGGASELDQWCNDVQNRAGTFDFSLRNALVGIVQGGGSFDLGTVPNYQQSNRQRTVPFVNNHDTFRPILDNDGNYIGWNTGQQLGSHIEPNDSRLSLVYAIVFAVDGAPMVYFEDLFNIGYNGNRFDHVPTNSVDLPMRSDLVNIIWCRQNLHFADGNYLIRWQENDALVIERASKALIAVNDQWSNWKNLIGVQTSWPDGTVLKDYSEANSNTVTVYGGGKIDIAIPPCDGTAPNGRKGYCIWAPDGLATNYNTPSETITQEWEMSDDLGDSHSASLQQGGQLPDQSKDCRVVGKVHADAQTNVRIELYPIFNNLSIDILLLDSNCNTIDSASGIGDFTHDFFVNNQDWFTIKVRNSTTAQLGQKCWVKINYQAPINPDLDIVKNKCACSLSSSTELMENNDASFYLFPNPANNYLIIESPVTNGEFVMYDMMGKELIRDNISLSKQLNIIGLKKGTYYVKLGSEVRKFLKL